MNKGRDHHRMVQKICKDMSKRARYPQPAKNNTFTLSRGVYRKTHIVNKVYKYFNALMKEHEIEYQTCTYVRVED